MLLSSQKVGRAPGRIRSHQNTVADSSGTFPLRLDSLLLQWSRCSQLLPLPCLLLSHPPSISSHLSLSLLWNCTSHRLSPQDREHDGKPPWDYNLSTEAKSAFTILGKRLFNLHLCIRQITKVWEGFIIRIESNVKDSRDCY